MSKAKRRKNEFAWYALSLKCYGQYWLEKAD
jgi:hypothetical protein